jgi:hypothetical protein
MPDNRPPVTLHPIVGSPDLPVNWWPPLFQ